MDREKSIGKNNYESIILLTYDNSIKYYEWQPARWAGNYSAINLMENYLNDVKSTIEVGAGKCCIFYCFI